MAVSWRRPSAFSTDNEFSLSQTDEIRIKSTPVSVDFRRSTQLSEEKKKQTIWIVYFIGFMVRCPLFYNSVRTQRGAAMAIHLIYTPTFNEYPRGVLSLVHDSGGQRLILTMVRGCFGQIGILCPGL